MSQESRLSAAPSINSFNADELLAHGARQIISLFIPVTVCMFFVVIVAKTVDFYSHTDHYLPYTPFHTPDADLGTRTWQAIANTLIFMAVIVVTTCILVLLFKYHCYKILRGWLILSTFFLLFLITFTFFAEVIRTMGIFVDYITMAVIVWNFGVVGMLAIHWRAPLLLQQFYLIFVSAQISLLLLKFLPKWTCWVLLGALAVWDLLAVLCPRGPLRVLVELAEERQMPLFPAMIYSTTATYVLFMVKPGAADRKQYRNALIPPRSVEPVLRTESSALSHETLLGGAIDSLNSTGDHIQCPDGSHQVVLDDQPLSHPTDVEPSRICDSELRTPDVRLRHLSSSIRDPSPTTASSAPPPNVESTNRWRAVQADLRDREDRGVKLGLGDFVFYSLLIGRAALDGDAVTVASCYVAILVGMCVTIIVLGITRRALPALPISIACGILFYFTTSVVISPFLEICTANRLVF